MGDEDPSLRELVAALEGMPANDRERALRSLDGPARPERVKEVRSLAPLPTQQRRPRLQVRTRVVRLDAEK